MMVMNVQLVASILPKRRSIMAGTGLQSFKAPEPEMPPTELATELVKAELQEFRLYVVVCIKNASFGIADGDMHSRRDLACSFPFIHDACLMGSQTAGKHLLVLNHAKQEVIRGPY